MYADAARASGEGNESSNTGLIVGLSVALGLLVLSIIGALAFVYYRRCVLCGYGCIITIGFLFFQLRSRTGVHVLIAVTLYC